MRRRTRLKLPFKRRRQGKTNYKKRLRLLMSKKPRLVIRKHLRHTRCQIVGFTSKGDETLLAVSTSNLAKFGWTGSLSNVPSAYLTGVLVGKEALKKNVKEAIADIGMYPNTKGSRINAVVKGAVDAGLKVPHSPDVFPDDKRIRGEHILAYFKSNKNKFTRSKPDKQLELFDKVKEKILEGK